MSCICQKYVLVLFMTSICLRNPTYVLIESNFCPHVPTFVLFLSFRVSRIHWKIGGQKLVKIWTWLFLHLPSGHTAARQTMDNLWIQGNPMFVHYLSKSQNCFQMHAHHRICGKDKSWTNIRTQIPSKSIIWPSYGLMLFNLKKNHSLKTSLWVSK